MNYDPIFPTTKGVLRKLGGDKETSVIFPEAELNLVFYDDIGFYFAEYIESVPFAITTGQQYKVCWNGVEYACTAIAVSDGESAGAYIGNGGLLGLDDTGEPFCIAYSTNIDGDELVQIATADSTATMSISTETIVPIDPKYLPGVPHFNLVEMGLPTVQLDGTQSVLEYDITELRKAILSGSVWLTIKANVGAEVTVALLFNGSTIVDTNDVQATAVCVLNSVVVVSVVLSFDGLAVTAHIL